MDRCVACGKYAPEGKQVCWICEQDNGASVVAKYDQDKPRLDLVPLIEQALGFQLYESQRNFLIHGDPKIFYGGRANGKTMVYCIDLALSEGEPLLVYPDSIKTRYESYELSDEDLRHGLYHAIVDETHGKRYEKFFKDMFIDIWRDLKEAGLPVRELRWRQ